MATLRHKTFVGPTFYTHGRSLNENREVIRAQAEAFVNAIGLENVVSVCEHAMTLGPFSVVVWYRGGAAYPDGTPVVQVGNDLIARAMERAPESQPAASSGASGWWGWVVLALVGGMVLALAMK